MTDSNQAGATTVSRPGKRERLVAAARDLAHRQGMARTTLAHIADEADVPLGNVYYYFKTKDDIVGAVVESHAENLRSALDGLEQRHRGPSARLKAFVRFSAEQAASSPPQYGCPYGTLSSELAKRPDGPDSFTAQLMQIQLDWAERQFRAMGQRDAPDLAVELVSSSQGSALLTSALGQPQLMTRQARRLERWLDALHADETGPGTPQASTADA